MNRFDILKGKTPPEKKAIVIIKDFTDTPNKNNDVINKIFKRPIRHAIAWQNGTLTVYELCDGTRGDTC